MPFRGQDTRYRTGELIFTWLLSRILVSREQKKSKNESFNLFQMGCGLCSLRTAPFRLRNHIFLDVSVRTLVGHGVYGADLFGERVVEYQRSLTQPHPQSVL